jgi:hypothetical protein
LAFYEKFPGKPRLGGKGGGIHAFFKRDKGRGKGKENIPVKAESQLKAEMIQSKGKGKEKDKVPNGKNKVKHDEEEVQEKATKKPRKSKVESDESDFVMKDEEDVDESADESLKSVGALEEEDESLNEDDLESLAEEDVGESSDTWRYTVADRSLQRCPNRLRRILDGRRRQPRRNQQSSCMRLFSIATCADNRSGYYKTGVRPLGQDMEVKQAIKNMSEDLPPLNDVETMFDHLVSRVNTVIYLCVTAANEL